MPEQTVRVELGPQSYNITVSPGLLSRIGSALVPLYSPRKVGIITDSTVAPLHLQTLQKSLEQAGFSSIVSVLPAGESHKTLADLHACYDTLLQNNLERSTPIIALGGGVVGDMAGFVAATVLRGVPFVQIPTTLLAMVDASVGGKTGINHTVGKNLIGAFHQPAAVLIDPQVLSTLPPRELRGGLAECIKHDLIADAAGFTELENNIGRALRLDIDYLTTLIAHNVSIKAKVVQADPFEKGIRAHLNFGHTFGHAIENVSHYAYSHGESVALGMMAAAYASVQMKSLDEPSRLRIKQAIQQVGLPIAGLKLDPQKIVDAMLFDKKVSAGKVRFVLLDGIGKAVIRNDVPADIVRAAVESLMD
jgi:3-dehydroquinate synthase